MAKQPNYLDCPIWAKIVDFNFDEVDSHYTLSKRLANENGWSHDYAKAVLYEYKRFLYLCVMGNGKSFTPSDQVDQAWHMHMIYTRSYWNDLCKDTLGKDLHHGPTKGGKEETDKFRDVYGETLETYNDTFGNYPPASIWPETDDRFTDIHFRRVSLKENVVLSKERIINYLGGTAAIIMLGLVSFMFMSSATIEEAREFDGWKTFWLVASLATAYFIIRGIYRYITYNAYAEARRNEVRTITYSDPYNDYEDEIDFTKRPSTASKPYTFNTPIKKSNSPSKVSKTPLYKSTPKSKSSSGSSSISSKSSNSSSSSSDTTYSDGGISAASAFFGCSTSSSSGCSSSSSSSSSGCSSSSSGCGSSGCSSGCGGGCGGGCGS